MKYLPLNNLKNAWIFKHKSLPIVDTDLNKIKLMAPERANVLWDTFISRQVDHPDFFKKGDWPTQKSRWLDQGNWENKWDSSEPQLPQLIMSHLTWDQNTAVYYCCSRDTVLETTWLIFQKYWKNFLFMDDGPILLGKRRQQVVQFNNNGNFKVGTKPE